MSVIWRPYLDRLIGDSAWFLARLFRFSGAMHRAKFRQSMKNDPLSIMEINALIEDDPAGFGFSRSDTGI